jgi:hypothetical protein
LANQIKRLGFVCTITEAHSEAVVSVSRGLLS